MGIITLTERQETEMIALCGRIADRASESNIPLTEYMDNLRVFILAVGPTRKDLAAGLRANRAMHYSALLNDERSIMNILALCNASTAGFVSDLITMMTRFIQSELL
jgi:hypothetical protein